MSNQSVTLTCPSCGNRLRIASDVNRFACGYCGNEQIVKREGGIVSLVPIVEGLEKIRIGVDKTASELAIPRIKGEIQSCAEEITRITELVKNEIKRRTKPMRIISSPLEMTIRYFLGKIYGYDETAPMYGNDLHQPVGKLTSEQLEMMLQYANSADPTKIFNTILHKMDSYKKAYSELKEILQPMARVTELKSLITEKLEELARHQQIVKS